MFHTVHLYDVKQWRPSGEDDGSVCVSGPCAGSGHTQGRVCVVWVICVIIWLLSDFVY